MDHIPETSGSDHSTTVMEIVGREVMRSGGKPLAQQFWPIMVLETFANRLEMERG